MSSEQIDMYDELFIPVAPGEMKLWIPPKSEEEYLEDLDSGLDAEEKLESLRALVEIYRFRTSSGDATRDEHRRNAFIELLRLHATKDPALTEVVGSMLVRLGSHCENIKDFESSIKFYEGGLSLEIRDPERRYFNFNNLGFCCNFMRRFSSAEIFTRAAIDLDPERYNAWKNLGVSLEHQGQYDEAAECYIAAITRSAAESRSVGHLKRLIARRPGLKRVYDLSEFVPAQH